MINNNITIALHQTVSVKNSKIPRKIMKLSNQPTFNNGEDAILNVKLK